MDRRILFKGKSIDTGEWIEGSLITDVYYRREDRKSIPYILCPDKAEFDCFGDLDEFHGIYEVDEETLCQQTGLTDKNGKPIWENDILMCHGNPDDLVKAVYEEFDVVSIETEEIVDRAIGWHYEVVPTDALSKMEPFCYPMPLNQQNIKQCGMEVIGNIFDNPELLKGEKNGKNI